MYSVGFNAPRHRSILDTVWDVRLPFAAHLFTIVRLDVEWRPNPLNADVGTVCISFSHLERKNPNPLYSHRFPVPLSAYPRPRAFA